MRRFSLRTLFKLAAFLPALLLGAWLIDYTQREAARPEAGKTSEPVRASTLDGDYTIDLKLAPEVVEFSSFIHYGEPIRSEKGEDPGAPHVIRITSKRIEMPVFKVTKPTAGDDSSESSDRKGIEPLVSDVIDRLIREASGDPSAEPNEP